MCVMACIFAVSLSHASHIVGGELYYDYLGASGSNNQYKLYLKIYRDCNSVNQTGTLTPFDQVSYITVFDDQNSIFTTFTMSLTNQTDVELTTNNPCLSIPPNVCIDEGYYERTIFLPPSANGYKLVYQRCCRNNAIGNIYSPGQTGATYVVHIPGTNSAGTGAINSSPRLVNVPPLVLCLGDSINFNMSMTDNDGDSLVYSLCDAYKGASAFNPYPTQASFPPFQSVNWQNGYNATYPIDASPGFAYDPQTGTLTGTPTTLGLYVFGFCVSEYRNGVFLGESNFDYQFLVTICDPNSSAAISQQEAFCNGLEVKFLNYSENAFTFFWDFGVLTSTTDTSTQKEPVFTFPDTGKYNVMLVVNAGYSCADTTFTLYEVYPNLEAKFNAPVGQCLEGNNFAFNAGGNYSSYANFKWDFGIDANPRFSFVEEPQNIKFVSAGDIDVTLTIFENGCESEHTDTVSVVANPVPQFNTEYANGCKPVEVQFTSTSISELPLTYEWDFGDGTTSTLPNPKHVYNDSGRYDVMLRIHSTGECVDSRQLLKYNHIRVFPNPEAILTSNTTEVSVSNGEIIFANQSKRDVRCHLDYGDGLKDYICDVSHIFKDDGHYSVEQIVYSKHNCTDTNYLDIWIKPEFSFYVPNAFTPNGDGVNDGIKPFGDDIYALEFYIYDRWGQLLFQSNSLNAVWNGTHKGKQAPVDIYIYKAFIKDKLGNDHEIAGEITLLR